MVQGVSSLLEPNLRAIFMDGRALLDGGIITPPANKLEMYVACEFCGSKHPVGTFKCTSCGASL
jgi:hypothetical protein